jgi:hypothetical protein
MDPLSIASFGLGAAKSIFGLFDNSAAKQAHAQNVARVRAIDRANERTHFKNLAIRAKSLRQRANVPSRLQAIRTSQDQLRASRRLQMDRLVSDSLMDNQKDAIKMFQGMTGSRSGQMNLDSARLADLGRNNALRRNMLMRSRDDLITSGYLDNFTAQNMRSKVKASAAVNPIYQQYIKDYTPVQAPYTNKFAEFALGMGGAAFDAFRLNRELQPPPIGGLPNSNRSLLGIKDVPVPDFTIIPGVGGGLTGDYS